MVVVVAAPAFTKIRVVTSMPVAIKDAASFRLETRKNVPPV